MQPTRSTVFATKQRKRITFDDEDTIATMLEFSPGKAQVGKLVFYLRPTAPTSPSVHHRQTGAASATPDERYPCHLHQLRDLIFRMKSAAPHQRRYRGRSGLAITRSNRLLQGVTPMQRPVPQGRSLNVRACQFERIRADVDRMHSAHGKASCRQWHRATSSKHHPVDRLSLNPGSELLDHLGKRRTRNQHESVKNGRPANQPPSRYAMRSLGATAN